MAENLKTVLLLALPASGKSEVRRYLAHQTPEQRTTDFRMGPTVQLDDFPYVHMMRRVDEEMVKAHRPRIFFHGPDKQFQDPRDWGTLIQLLNEDYDDLVAKKVRTPSSAAYLLFDRIDAAGKVVGIAPRLDVVDATTKQAVAEALEAESAELLAGKHACYPHSLDGKTVVVEFARGGADGSKLPLEAPFGYRYSLAQLSPALLENAVILYVWVTPEESRRKNEARTDPDDPGSILHHGVPIEVMLGDYGCDDMGWLLEHSDVPQTVTVEAHGKRWHLPVGRFNNREDKTSFLRAERKDWAKADVDAVHAGLKAAIDEILASRSA
jgi:hypothetical protein